MSRADDIAKEIRKAAEHSRAPLLFAIAGASFSPTNAAIRARELGLLNGEERLAKWVAVFKRDAQSLYGMSFEDALCTILKQGDHPMKVVKGAGYYEAQLKNLLNASVSEVLEEKERSNLYYVYADLISPEGEKQRHGRVILRSASNGSPVNVCSENDEKYSLLITDRGIAKAVQVHVQMKELMPAMIKFGRRLEAMTRRKGFQEVPTEVTVVQDF
jgi:hypothetical protein